MVSWRVVLLLWLLFDDVSCRPRDKLFLGPTDRNDQVLELTLETALINPEAIRDHLKSKSFDPSDRDDWQKVDLLLQIYRTHGIADRLITFLHEPGVVDTVNSVMKRLLNQNKQVFAPSIDDVLSLAENLSRNNSIESADLLEISVQRCSGTCAEPVGATFDGPCQANTECAVSCPNAYMSNSASRIFCSCATTINFGRPFLLFEDRTQPHCVSDVFGILGIGETDSDTKSEVTPPEHQIFRPPVRCLGFGRLFDAAQHACATSSQCPTTLSEECCYRLSSLNECASDVIGSIWPQCLPSESVKAIFQDQCGPRDGQCLFRSDLLAMHQVVNCTLGNRLFAGMVCRAECEQGYVNVNPGAVVWYGCVDGHLTYPNLICLERECPVPTVLPLGLVHAPNSPCLTRKVISPGQSCTVLCAPGFVAPRNSKPAPQAPCSKGVLPTPSLPCVPGKSLPQPVGNLSMVTSPGCVVGALLPCDGLSRCTVTCRSGYDIVETGTMEYVCVNGELQTPSVRCAKLPRLPAAGMLPEGMTFPVGGCLPGGVMNCTDDSSCKVVCKPGYEMVGKGRTYYKCERGEIIGPEVTCARKDI
eukprot:c19794_g1_i3.p1 GENE.c19794_g1_i3~~c19794_g1_i3.p1  ORF type:complete len:588 (+),score=63.59 c19794_g1_i3:25-1788(+)